MLVDLALFSGLRVSEIANLKIGDIELTTKDPYLIVRKGKRGKKRDVYMDKELVNHLKTFIAWKKKTMAESVEVDSPLFTGRNGGITKDFYEAKLKEYDTELDIIEDKLERVDEVDKDFYITAEYILKLAKHSNQLFKRSEHDERRLLINTILLNATWDGVSLSYDYKEPFNLLAEMNESTVWGAQPDLNRRPLGPQPSALTNLSYAHHRFFEVKTLFRKSH